MTKACFMKGLDRVIHRSIRIFEQDNLFFLREPLCEASKASLKPRQPAYPPPTQQVAKPKKAKAKARRAHLVPAALQSDRYWSGAKGSGEMPKPFSVWRPTAPLAPPKAPQRLLQSRPKAKAKAAASQVHIDLDTLSDEIAPAPPRRRAAAEAQETQHARQASNILRSLAAVIAPRPSRAPTPIVIRVVSKSSELA